MTILFDLLVLLVTMLATTITSIYDLTIVSYSPLANDRMDKFVPDSETSIYIMFSGYLHTG